MVIVNNTVSTQKVSGHGQASNRLLSIKDHFHVIALVDKNWLRMDSAANLKWIITLLKVNFAFHQFRILVVTIHVKTEIVKMEYVNVDQVGLGNHAKKVILS